MLPVSAIVVFANNDLYSEAINQLKGDHPPIVYYYSSHHHGTPDPKKDVYLVNQEGVQKNTLTDAVLKAIEENPQPRQ
jgi:hypothetical protein